MQERSLPREDHHQTATPAAPDVGNGLCSTLDVRDVSLAYTLLRAAFGVNILMHGAARFGSIPGFVEAVQTGFAQTIVPQALVRGFAWIIVPAEFSIGVLLLIGFLTRPALLAGWALMVCLTVGVTLQQRWDVAGLQLVYVMTYALLVAGLKLNTQSVDGWSDRRNRP